VPPASAHKLGGGVHLSLRSSSSVVAASSSTPSGPEGPADLHSYIAWLKLREPLLVDIIEECLVVLS
jgi:hypothetical protein